MTLQNYSKAREAMVVSQLQPSGVVSERVMGAYRQTPREMFVPNALRSVCYLDEDLKLTDKRYLLEPIIHGLMLQDANIMDNQKVLDIGGGSGYSAAVLARLAKEVIALDQDEKLLQAAKTHWADLGIMNVTPVIGNHADGYSAGAQYDVILINGSVAQTPEALFSQLSPGGKLYFVLGGEEGNVGKLTVCKKDMHSDLVLMSVLGDYSTPYLVGFEPQKGFEF